LHNQSQPELVPFVEKLAAVMHEFGPDRFTVAEVGGEKSLAEMKLYTNGRKRLNTSYSFDFLYAERLTPELVLDTLSKWPGTDGEGWPSWAFSNHDAPRAVTRWGGPLAGTEWAKLLATLLMSLRGNVFLYQGEELGLAQAAIPFERLRDPEAIANWPLTLGRDGARTPMPWTAESPHAGFSSAEPWLPIPPDHVAKAVANQDGDAESVLTLTRELIALRRSSPALRLGAFEPLKLPSPILGFDRVSGQDRLRCLFNLGPDTKDCALLASGELLFSIGAVDMGRKTLGSLAGCILEVPG
jgi:alpha-glucosidase